MWIHHINKGKMKDKNHYNHLNRNRAFDKIQYPFTIKMSTEEKQFINVLSFSQYRYFTSLVKFIPRHFILMRQLNEIFFLFLLSLSTISLTLQFGLFFFYLPFVLLFLLVSTKKFLLPYKWQHFAFISQKKKEKARVFSF